MTAAAARRDGDGDGDGDGGAAYAGLGAERFLIVGPDGAMQEVTATDASWACFEDIELLPAFIDVGETASGNRSVLDSRSEHDRSFSGRRPPAVGMGLLNPNPGLAPHIFRAGRLRLDDLDGYAMTEVAQAWTKVIPKYLFRHVVDTHESRDVRNVYGRCRPGLLDRGRQRGDVVLDRDRDHESVAEE